MFTYSFMQPLFTECQFIKAKSRDKLPCKCVKCQKTFLVSKHLIQSRLSKQLKGKIKTFFNYCSVLCCNVHQRPPTIVKCEQCGASFKKSPGNIKNTKHNFCCHRCAGTYSSLHKTQGTRVSKLEKWIATQLSTLYPNLELHFNRKDAINGELDIFIPSLLLAFELNGIFHYEPIYGQEKLSQIQNNDNRKIQACLEHGIELCIIDSSSPRYFKINKAQKFLDIIVNIINNKIIQRATERT